MSQGGFPHSEIPGSKPVCGSPGLIAAYRVLHQLLAPRHSPYALSSLTIRNSKLTPLVTEHGPRGLRPATRQYHAHCVCVVGKLPFAGYSVVKEQSASALDRRAGVLQPHVWWRIPGSNR